MAHGWIFLFLCGFAHVVFSYKPVIVIHGLLDAGSNMQSLKTFIQEAHPGTEVHLVDLFGGYDSFQPMWKQVEGMKSVIMPIMKAAAEGVHIIGYSQGGLAARGIVQTTDDHNVNNLIALSSPLNGQYGDTYYLSWLFPNLVKKEMYEYFYSTEGQTWSVANYWKDPHEMSLYQQYSNFLAHLNNETGSNPSHFRVTWRANFEKLKKLVLIGGPSDEVITPWQSSQFGFYDDEESVVPMKAQEIYLKNNFGLYTLDRRNAVVLCTVSDVHHLEWHKNQTVFNECVAPHLD